MKPILTFEQERRVREALTAARNWKGPEAMLAHHIQLLASIIREEIEPCPDFENKVLAFPAPQKEWGAKWPVPEDEMPGEKGGTVGETW